MNKSVIILCPWSYGNGIYVTADQTKEVFNIIVKAFLTKYKYINLTEQGKTTEAQKYDLNDIKVFNHFVNLALDNILDPDAKDYVLESLRAIRDNNAKKRSVKNSYNTIYKMIDPSSNKFSNLRSMLAENMEIIDFCKLFKMCDKVTLTSETAEIKEVSNIYSVITDMGKFEFNLF